MTKRTRQEGFTLIELLIVVAIIGIIAAIAVPGLLRARMSGNETSAIGGMRAINTAQVNYSASCGNGGYAQLLTTLAQGPGASTANPYLSNDLTGVVAPVKSGFNYTMASTGTVSLVADCNGPFPTTAYYTSATPATLGSTGNRAFATNQSGAIWQNVAGVAPAEPFAVAAGISPIQ